MGNRIKNLFKSTNWINLFLVVLVTANIILITKAIINSKSNPTRRIFTSSSTQPNQIIQSDFFDSPCPDIEMVSTQGQDIKLPNFVGDVIVLRFTRSHPQDFPYLLYLEHLYNKFKDKGLQLFFIKLLERSETIPMNKPFDFIAPMIEDDGYIASLFQARLNDTIIVGKDFRIKFKHNQIVNRIIYNQIVRYLFEDSLPPHALSDTELASLLKKIDYRNIKNGELENLEISINNKPSLITLFVSQCLGCPEHRRITIMKQIASEIKPDKAQIILLFGKGNNFETTKKFAEQNDLLDYITIGVIQDSENVSNEDYYQIL